MQNTNPPNVTARPSAVALNEQILVSSMFTVFDADPDSQIAFYEIRDNGVGGGFFEMNGAPQNSGEWITILPSELSIFTYRGGSEAGLETFSVRVNDGLFTSNEALATVTSGNSSPVVTASDGRANPRQPRRIDNQFSVADADGDSIVEYVFFDQNLAANSGYFTLRGGRIFAQEFTVPAGDLPDLEFVGGDVNEPGSPTPVVRVDPIRVQAFDGFSYSANANFTMFTTTPPEVEALPVTVLTGQRRPALSMFDVSDFDGDTIDFYKFADYNPNAGGGYFEYDGMRMPSATWFNVPAAEVGTVFYVGADTPQAERVGFQVYDGFQFSNIDDAFVRTLERPTVSATRPVTVQANQYLNFATGTVNNEPGIVSGSDPFLNFSEGTERFEFIDLRINSDGGYFKFMGAQIPSATWFTVELDELHLLEYRGGVVGPQSEGIRARAFSNGVWSPVSEFSLATLENQFAPELTLFDVNSRLGTSIALEAMFTWSDGDGDALQRFGVFDTGADPESGYFTVNGVVQDARTWIILDFDQVGTVRYHMPTVPGEENIRMFVNDGRISSTNEFATMSAIPTPTIDVLENDISVDTLEGIAASSLITQTDGGPAFTQYQFFDENFDLDPNTPPADRSGRMFLRNPGAGNSGEALLGGVLHTLSAEQFSRLEFQGAEVDFGRQLDPIIVRATNGVTGWSEWHRVNVNTDPVGADALTQLPIHNAVIDGNKTVITYTFIDGDNQSADGTRTDPDRPPLPSYYPAGPDLPPGIDPADEALGTRALDQVAREMHREVLAYFESVINVDFVEVPFTLDAADASMVFGAWGAADGSFDTRPDAAAYAYPVFDGDGRGNIGSDIWYATSSVMNQLPDGSWVSNDVGKGGFFRSTAFHEIGHAMGLSHPFDGDPFLSVFNDFQYNTIMAYTRDNVNNPFPTVYPEESATLMLYDLVALQEQYGANTDFNSGNNHYFYSINEEHQETLWDGGGNDTLNFTNHVGRPLIAGSIDLNRNGVIDAGDAGTYSGRLTDEKTRTDITVIGGAFDIDNSGGIDENDDGFINDLQVIDGLVDIDGNGIVNVDDNGFMAIAERMDLREGTWSTWNGLEQSIRIAYNAQIENARGGTGDDDITGNEVANLLMGNDGFDTLRGGGGNDVVRGGAGDDCYVWSLGDGRDIILEDGMGGQDSMQFFDPSGAITTLEDDFTFRRFGDNFRIDLTLNQGPTQGSTIMLEYSDAASQVETLQIHGLGGLQIGGDIDLTSIFNQSTNIGQRFRVTEQSNDNGFIAVPV